VRRRGARIFNNYGPRIHPNDGGVVSNFIVQALNGAPITLYGRRHTGPRLLLRDDLIDGLVKRMAAPDTSTGPINLGNPGPRQSRIL